MDEESLGRTQRAITNDERSIKAKTDFQRITTSKVDETPKKKAAHNYDAKQSVLASVVPKLTPACDRKVGTLNHQHSFHCDCQLGVFQDSFFQEFVFVLSNARSNFQQIHSQSERQLKVV